MASEEKNNHIPSAKKDAQMKLRRHEIYKLVSAEKREALLLQRRTNRQELQRNTVSEVAAFHVQGQCVADLQNHSPTSQNPRLMDLSTVSTATANEFHLAAFPVTSTKQKNVAPSFCVYEVGSTSGTSNSNTDMASKIIQNRAHNQRRSSWVNIGQLQSDYVHLKIVPNCKFCDAKRFEYEPPEFCCSSGSIKLVSNQVPTELRDLFLGNTEESEHFRTYIRTYNNMFAFTSLGVNYDKELARRNHGIYTFRV